MRLVGSFNAPLNCIDDLGVEGSGMWVILIEEARDLVMLGSRIWTSEEPENLGLETGLAFGLSLTILAWLGLLLKLVLSLGEAVIEKGFDVLVIIFVLGSDGEGEIVNLEFWDKICWLMLLTAEELLILLARFLAHMMVCELNSGAEENSWLQFLQGIFILTSVSFLGITTFFTCSALVSFLLLYFPLLFTSFTSVLTFTAEAATWIS